MQIAFMDDHRPAIEATPEQLERKVLVAELETLRRRVKQAKLKASESLSRANEAPEPHDTTNTVFVALYDSHWRDREELFSVMRQLDAAYRALEESHLRDKAKHMEPATRPRPGSHRSNTANGGR